jgi:hypothetical protein
VGGFFVVQPEVAVATVQGSGASAVCVFDAWLGDELVRAHPLLLATTPLKAALSAVAPTGLSIARARVRRSAFFRGHSPDRGLPVFWALNAENRPGVDDAALTEDGSFVVSRRVLDVLMEFRVARAVFAQYRPYARRSR